MANGDYAEMIELPVSTCEMVIVPEKKKKPLKDRLLIKHVNKKAEKLQKIERETAQTTDGETEKTEPVAQITEFVNVEKSGDEGKKANKKTSRKGRERATATLIGAEIAAIFVLVVAIILTNVFLEDSGINTMIKNVFGASSKSVTDTRKAEEFAVFAPSSGAEITLNEGVMTFSTSAAVYPPTNGKIISVSEKDGKYTVTIAHTDVFKTVISGAEAVYGEVGESVYKNVPTALSCAGTTVAMYNGSELVTDFVIDKNNVIWQS